MDLALLSLVPPVAAVAGGAGNSPLPVIVALAAGIVIGGFGALVLVIRPRWLGPVRAISTTADELAAGRWSARWSAPSGGRGAGETQRLGDRLNRVAAVAQSRFASLAEQSANLKLLVDALPDPILLSDEHDRIVLINAPAERLLGLPPQQVVGRPFVAAVNDPSVLDLFESCKRRRAERSPADAPGEAVPVDREIKLLRNGQRLMFQAHAEHTPAGGVLVVLRDVSRLAATIQMKTDFVANASHELRTPISAIKVAFETLRDVHAEDPQQTDRCITIIDGHLKRLEEMLRDLLDLSRVENADLKPQLTRVRSGELTGMLKSIWQPAARERGVELIVPGPGEDVEFVSDRRLLDLILKNLVENAIKFTPAGGRVTVTISRDESSGRVTLGVADTGCGIPDEHRERVFERFYQVNSARSGAAGRGTGLGLAIVKHAANALSGQVTLTSRVGHGTTIVCTLPQGDGVVAEG